MATQLYMSRQRWVATLVLAMSIALFWWSVGVRLGSAADLDRQRARVQALEFRINTLRWQRDALNVAELVATRQLARQRLLNDPDGLPRLVDELQELAAQYGMGVAVTVAGSEPYAGVDGVLTRDLSLRFSGVLYDTLVAYLGAIEQQSDRWILSIRDVSLTSRGGDVEVNGRVQLRFWTTQAGLAEEQESLY